MLMKDISNDTNNHKSSREKKGIAQRDEIRPGHPGQTALKRSFTYLVVCWFLQLLITLVLRIYCAWMLYLEHQTQYDISVKNL